MCSICYNWFPCTRENFYKNKSNKVDGFHPYCLECAREKSKKHGNENAERRSSYIKEYYPQNKEKFSYKYKDKEKFKSYQKEYRQSEQGKEIFKKHREKRIQHKKHDITIEEWDACRLYFNYRCAYCGMTYEEQFNKFKKDLHKEHADSEGANNLSNCIPSCTSCNSSKHTKKFEDWYNNTNPVYSESRLSKIKVWLEFEYKKFINQ